MKIKQSKGGEPMPCGHGRGTECVTCETFKCAGCSRWLDWSKGAADDMPDHCDRCWAGAHRKAS